MLEKLKVAKLEKKLAEQKLLKLTELEDRVLAFEARLEAALAMLRKSMITNAFCLEFNKDLYDTIQALTLDHEEKSQDFEQGVCFAVKTIKQLQTQHNIFSSRLRAGDGPNQVGLELNFDVRIDELETFVQETQEFIKRGHIQKKTIKIDLDAISSGEDSDSSSSGSRQNYIEIHEERQSPPSGMDFESNSLQFGIEQSEWNQTAGTKQSKARKAAPKVQKVPNTKKPAAKEADLVKPQTEMPPTSFERLRQQYKQNQVKFNLLLEKYQKQSKKFMQLEDELKELKHREFENKFRIQLEQVDKRHQEAKLQIETLKQQIRDGAREAYQIKQQNQTQQTIIEQLTSNQQRF